MAGGTEPARAEGVSDGEAEVLAQLLAGGGSAAAAVPTGVLAKLPVSCQVC